MRKILKTSVAVLAAVFVLASGLGVAFAASSQVGTIRGTVMDGEGNPLPGAVVTVSSESLIREKGFRTSPDGKFFAAQLPPGDYKVTAEFPGHVKILQTTIVVLDQTTVMDFQLKSGAVTETVTVTATKPVVDKSKTENAVVIDTEFTNKLPTVRSYQSLLQFAPGVSGGSNPNILGGTSSSNNYLVDGASGRDPVTGTFGFNLTFDAIEAVDVKLTGVSAEYGQFQGGVTNLITKSGGNQFTGSIRDVIDSPSWTKQYSSSALKEFAPGFTGSIPGRGVRDITNEFNTTLGGPIVKDSAWFFLSYRRIEAPRTVTLANPLGGPSGDGIFAGPRQGDFALIKGTWQATNNHRLQYQYTDDPVSLPVCYSRFFGNTDGCYEQYNVEKQTQGGFIWTGNWEAVWSPRIISNVRVSKSTNGFPGNFPQAPVPIRPGLPLSGSGKPALNVDLTSGSIFDNTVFASDPEDRIREAAEAVLTTFIDSKKLGSHTLKVGLEYVEQERIGSSVIAGDAIFYFDFVTPPPGFPPGTGDPYDINNRIYDSWLDFAPASKAGPINEFTTLFIQDNWALNEKWNFSLGLRLEDSVNKNDVGEKVIDSFGIAPRFGASFDPSGEGKHVIKATAGRYLAGINLTTLSPFVRAAGGQSEYTFYVNENAGAGNPAVAGTPVWTPSFTVTPDTETSQFADGIDPQAIDEYTLGYEFSVTPTFGLSGQLIRREWDDITTVMYSFDYSQPLPRQIQRIDNNPRAKREYTAFLLEAERRFSNNWQLLANYTWSEAEGNVESDNGFETFGSFAGVPQATNNRFGKLAFDLTHQVKAAAIYDIPLSSKRHGVSVGGSVQWLSGNAYGERTSTSGALTVVGPGADAVQDSPLGSTGAAISPTDQTAQVVEYFEPRGSREEPSTYELDLSLNYKFRFSKKVNFDARFEVFNVTDEQKPDEVNSTSGATFGFPSSFGNLQTPRNYRLQFAVTW